MESAPRVKPIIMRWRGRQGAAKRSLNAYRKRQKRQEDAVQSLTAEQMQMLRFKPPAAVTKGRQFELQKHL